MHKKGNLGAKESISNYNDPGIRLYSPDLIYIPRRNDYYEEN
jgi:hypothetical protein